MRSFALIKLLAVSLILGVAACKPMHRQEHTSEARFFSSSILKNLKKLIKIIAPDDNLLSGDGLYKGALGLGDDTLEWLRSLGDAEFKVLRQLSDGKLRALKRSLLGVSQLEVLTQLGDGEFKVLRQLSDVQIEAIVRLGQPTAVEVHYLGNLEKVLPTEEIVKMIGNKELGYFDVNKIRRMDSRQIELLGRLSGEMKEAITQLDYPMRELVRGLDDAQVEAIVRLGSLDSEQRGVILEAMSTLERMRRKKIQLELE